MKNWIIGFVVAILALPTAALAHEGHVHKALGTVTNIEAKEIVVKTTDGKMLTVLLDAKTDITRGKVKHDAAALKVGERVSVDYTEKNKVNTAKAIKLAELPAATKNAPKK
jgi:hypothetical protein